MNCLVSAGMTSLLYFSSSRGATASVVDAGGAPDEVAAATGREDLEAAREFLEPGR